MKVGEAGLVDGELATINQIHDDGTLTVDLDGQGIGFATIDADRFEEV